MVTRVVAGRAYDFSHAMGRGGMGFSSGSALAFSSDNLVYVLSRGGEAITAGALEPHLPRRPGHQA